MRLLKRRIGTRLLAGFAATSILILAIGLFSGLRLRDFNRELGLILELRVARLLLVDSILSDIEELGQSAQEVLLSDSEAEARQYLDMTTAKRTQIGEGLERLGRMMGEQEGDARALRESLEAQSSGFLVGIVKFTRHVASGHMPEARALLKTTLEPKRLAILAAIREFRRVQSDALVTARAEVAAGSRNTLFAIALMSAGAIGLGIVLGLWITRTIVRPIRKAVAVADDVADGRLDREIVEGGHDETGQLMGSLARMQQRMREVIESIVHAARSVNAGAGEIAAGSADISSRTELQAAHLQATTSTMQKLTEAVGENAENASQASRLAKEASAAAMRGGEAMQQVVNTMKGIAESSERIEAILSVIDAIAFQTNILALNAAVEAARAGEQGRGFAVVAGEVRNLAQRSAAAAKEIKALIGDSAQRVASGRECVDGAGSQMNEIVRLVNGVTNVIDKISAASVEQSEGIGNVTDAVRQIDETTQQNAAVVERAAHSATRLDEEARKLVDALGVFKIAAAEEVFIS